MVIDSHSHLKHGDPAGTEYTPAHVVEIMDAAGIDRSVVFAMSTTTERSIELALAAAREFPGRLIPYAYALPAYDRPVLRDLERAVRELGFRGIKLHAGQCRLLDYVVDPLFGLLGELGVPCLVDLGGDEATARRLAKTFPDTQTIIAHMGQYLCPSPVTLDRFIGLGEEHANVFLDTSGVLWPWKIAEAARRLGSDRVLFGIDGPHPYPDPVTYAEAEIAKIRALDLDEADVADILGGSLARLLKLE